MSRVPSQESRSRHRVPVTLYIYVIHIIARVSRHRIVSSFMIDRLDPADSNIHTRTADSSLSISILTSLTVHVDSVSTQSTDLVRSIFDPSFSLFAFMFL